jgi:hypothetical protein
LYALDFTRMLVRMASETGLTRADATELNDIVWHWEKAYGITYDGAAYSAARIGYPEHILTADTAGELRSLIRSDYRAWLAGLRERSSL